MLTVLAASPSLNQTSTHTYSNAVSAILVVLAVCGVIYILTQPTRIRFIVLIILAGIFIVGNNGALSLGASVRDGVIKVGNNFHMTQLVSGTVFTVLILAALALVGQQLLKRHRNNVATPGWYIAFFLLVLVFFTFSWAQEAILAVSQWAVWVLDALSKL